MRFGIPTSLLTKLRCAANDFVSLEAVTKRPNGVTAKATALDIQPD